ncbi:MAG: hypothetical protein HOV87_32265, partial [Catenulispora sp.]|nr:hypothetical protein [Catenulispora sp.]
MGRSKVSRMLGGAVLAFTLSAGASITTLASPAAAGTAAPIRAADAGGILGNVSQVLAVAQTIRSGINDFAQFSGATPPPLTLVQQIQALIAQSQAAVITEIDSVAQAQLQGSCDAVWQQFSTFTDPKNAADLPAFVRAQNTCVDVASHLITGATANTDKRALDVYSLTMNFGAAQALLASAYGGFPTDGIRQEVVNGDEALLTKLAPTCGSTPNDDPGTVEQKFFDAAGSIPGDDGAVALPGHNACYAYSVPAPVPFDGHLIFFPTGPGTGAEPWTLTGDGEPEICGIFFTCGAHINWPPQSDFAIAQDQAMAATSWPIAKNTLGQLLPDAAPFQSQVSLLTPVAGSMITTPMPAFRVDASGVLERATVNPNDNRNDVTFSGWSKDTTPNAPLLKSVAAVANADSRYQVFGLDRAGRLYTQWEQRPRDNTSWSPWDQLAGPADNTLFGSLSSVTAARNQNGAVQIFANDARGVIYTRTIVPGGDIAQADQPQNGLPPAIDDWGPWQQMDGLTVSLSATVNPDNEIVLFGVNAGGQLFQRQQSGPNRSSFSVAGNWAPWSQITGPGNGGVALKTVSATVDLLGAPTVLATDGSNRLWHWPFGGPWDQVGGTVQYMAAAKGGGGAGEEYVIIQDPAGALTLSAMQVSAWQNQFCTLDSQRSCNIHEVPITAYQSGAKTFSTLTSRDGKTHDTGAAMAAGSSPASAMPPAGGTGAMAYVGADGFLYFSQQGTAVKVGGGLAVAPGTSPSLGMAGFSTWDIVFVRPGGQLATFDSTGTLTLLNGVAAPGTSPAMDFVPSKHEFDPGAGFWVAFQNAADHLLWTISPGNQAAKVGAGYPLTAGTRPAISRGETDDAWQIAFNQAGGTLATIDNLGNYRGSIA